MGSVTTAVVVVLMILLSLLPYTTTETTLWTTECPLPPCVGNCRFTAGSSGNCLICECGPTCSNVTCGPYEICIMQLIDCGMLDCLEEPICVQNGTAPPSSTTPTTPEATTAACATVVCGDNCCAFTKTDGCSECICPNPWKIFKCPKGYECKLREVTHEPFCVPKPCPPRDPCNIHCMNGFKKDKNGCQTCECVPA